MLYSKKSMYNVDNPFHSFLMGGFECADHMNAFGNRVDLYENSGHIKFLEQDYQRAKLLGIKTIREGVRWSFVEKEPYHYNWTEVERMIEVADKYNIQIIFDLCHFGYPDDLTPLHPMFARRFSHFCRAFAEKFFSINCQENLILTPINEVSFISWLGGEVRGTSPYCINNGWDVKYHLMRAYIEGVAALKEFNPQIKILATEPLINIVAEDHTNSESVLSAKVKHEEQFQVLDILTGKVCPELGGRPEFLDFIGVNYYYNNQWINETHEYIPWADIPSNPHYKDLSRLISEIFIRYGKPILISETSHPGEDRAKWLRMIKDECLKVHQNGIPLLGCCIYPLVDRPDWDFLNYWHHSGIWDIEDPCTLERIVCDEAFAACQQIADL